MAANGHGSEASFEPVRVAVIGLGYWGPNLVRNLNELPEAEVVAICDMRHDAARAPGTTLPGHPSGGRIVRSSARRPDDRGGRDRNARRRPITGSRSRALEAGKHVFVEKPLAGSVADAADIVAFGAREAPDVMPGHTFLYSPAVNLIRDQIQNGESERRTSSR